MLFSDALVIGGMVSHEEIAMRSSIGFYVYSSPGERAWGGRLPTSWKKRCIPKRSIACRSSDG
jgi:hypothetical protein